MCAGWRREWTAGSRKLTADSPNWRREWTAGSRKLTADSPNWRRAWTAGSRKLTADSACFTGCSASTWPHTVYLQPHRGCPAQAPGRLIPPHPSRCQQTNSEPGTSNPEPYYGTAVCLLPFDPSRRRRCYPGRTCGPRPPRPGRQCESKPQASGLNPAALEHGLFPSTGRPAESRPFLVRFLPSENGRKCPRSRSPLSPAPHWVRLVNFVIFGPKAAIIFSPSRHLPQASTVGVPWNGAKSSARFPFYPLPRSWDSPWPRLTGNVRRARRSPETSF